MGLNQTTGLSTGSGLWSGAGGLSIGSGVWGALSLTKWSTVNKNARVVLSNSNLTCAADTTASTFESGRTDVMIASGALKYMEFTCDVKANAGDSAVGIIDASFSFADGQWVGIDAHGFGYYPNGQVIVSAAAVTTIATYGQGDVVSMAVNGLNKVWFRVNAGGWNNDVIANQNPALNIGGVNISALAANFPAYTNFDRAGVQTQYTARFSSGSWTQGAPAGFTQP